MWSYIQYIQCVTGLTWGEAEASPSELVLLVSVWSEAGQHFVHFPNADCQIQLLHPDLMVLAEHCSVLFAPLSVTGVFPTVLNFFAFQL